MMHSRLCFGAAFAVFAFTPAMAAEELSACPAERAVYELPSEYGLFRVSFVPGLHYASTASGLYLKLESPQRVYWFNFDSSMGYGGTSVNPVSDPYAEEARENGPRDLLPEGEGEDYTDQVVRTNTRNNMVFYTLDAELNFASDPPQAGQTAPPFLMMPEIGMTLWYGPAELTDDETASRDPMPRGTFRLTQCFTETPPPAFP